MKPLICPQCGGKLTNYSQWQNFATCGYCATRFIIEPEKSEVSAPVPTVYEQFQPVKSNTNIFIGVITSVVLLIGGLLFIAIVSDQKDTPRPVYNPPKFPSPYPLPSLTPTPNPNLLEFGGKGTGNGLFQDANAVAVDSKERIYVSDDSLRVQQFDEKGTFLKLWQIPSQTKYYERARTIQKIAVDEKDRLYVLVGGVIQIWEQNTTDSPENTLHSAPDFIVDFALKSDGGLLIVSVNNEIETLIYMNKNNQVARRIRGFHTETADASMSPYETGLAAIRLAVDGAGNIFSIYALGDLGSYQLSYNEEDFMIFRFTPEGKYVNKFVQTMNSCGISVDNQSRVYISGNESISIYSNFGEQVSVIPDLKRVDAFTLDNQNDVYIVADNKVFKRKGIN